MTTRKDSRPMHWQPWRICVRQPRRWADPSRSAAGAMGTAVPVDRFRDALLVLTDLPSQSLTDDLLRRQSPTTSVSTPGAGHASPSTCGFKLAEADWPPRCACCASTRLTSDDPSAAGGLPRSCRLWAGGQGQVVDAAVLFRRPLGGSWAMGMSAATRSSPSTRRGAHGLPAPARVRQGRPGRRRIPAAAFPRSWPGRRAVVHRAGRGRLPTRPASTSAPDPGSPR